jgi:hypothetical protein
MKNNVWKKMALLAVIWIFAAVSSLSAYAGDFKLGYNTNASSNDYIFTTKAPKGNIGKSMSIPFRIRATDEDMNNLRVSLLETSDFQQIESSGDSDYTMTTMEAVPMITPKTVRKVLNFLLRRLLTLIIRRSGNLIFIILLLFCFFALFNELHRKYSCCNNSHQNGTSAC